MENNDRATQLLHKIELLSQQQDFFSKEIKALREEIYQLKYSTATQAARPEPVIVPENKIESMAEIISQHKPAKKESILNLVEEPEVILPNIKSNIEKFIGENLINKIGIAITILGVAIGAKYSIDHDLISPLTRIILGYLMGLGLLGFGMKLKARYENYSAVLVSGAIAIMYFITYAAYSFYNLIPQLATFLMMVIFTVFTVAAAINYNKQIIAHIGLVGAYAVPFLLSDGSGKVIILFSYIAIINTGILFIAFKRYWKPLYYVSFALTWLIYAFWYTSDYQTEQHFSIALVFLSIFFITFYLIFLAYKLIRNEKFEKPDIIFLLINSFIFYGLGYAILSSHKTGEQLLGLFTLCNAIIHFIVSVIIYRKKLADRQLFFLVAGLVLVFITIAIPVQLDGNWVTLVWAGEAALLFWIGRNNNVSFYEKLSYPIMALAFFSLAQDWVNSFELFYNQQQVANTIPLFNINFLSTLLFIAAFGFIFYTHTKKPADAANTSNISATPIITYAVSAILLIVIYYAFRIEISTYFNRLYINTAIHLNKQHPDNAAIINDEDLMHYKTIWLINYSFLFFSLLSFLNIKKIKNRELGLINLALNIIILVVFITQGIFNLSELRTSYQQQSLAEYYHRGYFNILIRFISYAFAGLSIFSIYKYLKQNFLNPLPINTTITFDLLLYSTLLCVLSSELVTWMDIMHSTQSFKLGLSILWGIFALCLIAIGIWKKKKHLRIAAIILFALTLAKLFLYDIASLNTIAKTIVFVSLGVLLLIISFLYNKYKHLIFDETEI